jgi:hypothetical protein
MKQEHGPRRPLRIAIVAPPWVPVPPPAYGGTEAVLDNLARGLRDAGHEVMLFATGDSQRDVPTRWALERGRAWSRPVPQPSCTTSYTPTRSCRSGVPTSSTITHWSDRSTRSDSTSRWSPRTMGPSMARGSLPGRRRRVPVVAISKHQAANARARRALLLQRNGRPDARR